MTAKPRKQAPATRFAAVADETLDAWQAARRQVLRQPESQDALHQWRILSRRLMALEALLAPRARPAPADSLQHHLEHAFRAAGKVRDAGLAVQKLDAAAARHPVASRVARDLRQRLPARRAKLVRKLAAVKPRQLRQIVRSWRGARPAQFEAAALHRATLRLARQDRAVTADALRPAAGHQLHRQRLRLKQLRYMLEAWRAAGGRADASAWTARGLAARQRRLGEATDQAMLLRIIARHARGHPRRRAELAALTNGLQRQRRR